MISCGPTHHSTGPARKARQAGEFKRLGSTSETRELAMSQEILTGSCLCGAITYEIRSPFLRFAHCHCRRCRKATGTGHATNLYAAPDRFHWTSGEDLVARFDLASAESFATTFCRNCGSPLPHHTRSGREMVVPAGSLDVQPMQMPQARIFWDSRASWACSSDDLPRFSEYPEWWR